MSSETAFADLERDGWALFPVLERDVLEKLAGVAADFAKYARSDLKVGGTQWDLDRGLRNVWRTDDAHVRRSFEARITEVLRPSVERMFPGYRALVFGLTTKLAGLPHEPLPYHRDQTMVDERGGKAALHLWIPLVDISAENGGLIVVSGTHLTAPPIRPLGVTERDPLADCSVEDLPQGAVLPEMAAGTVLAFDGRTTHASTVNRSDHDRPAIMVCLLPHGAHMIEWVPRGDQVELWQVREDDSSYVGRADARIRLLETVPWTARATHDEQLRGEPPPTPVEPLPPPPSVSGDDVCESVARLLEALGPIANFRLASARAYRERIVLDWVHNSGGGLQVLFERLSPGQPCYKRIHDLGLSYNPPRDREGKLDADGVALLGTLSARAVPSLDALRALMTRAPS